ncbi:hypothetical protein ABK040_005755 [Willaertia magna]
MPEQITLGSTTAHTSSMGFNLSLLKGGTITQTILGAIISSMVVVAVVVTIVMVSVNVGFNPPNPKDDYLQVYKNTLYTIQPLLNDADPAQSNLTILNATQPQYGAVYLKSNTELVYMSNYYYAGNDSFTYTVSNGFLSAVATIHITVLNRPPELIPLYYTVSKNSINNVFDIFNYVSDGGAKITDPDADILSIVNVTAPSVEGSTFTFNDQRILYTPRPEFNQEDTFNYTVSDRNTTVTNTITIKIINDAPVARPDSYTIPKNKIAILDVLLNDYDPNGDNITLVREESGQGGMGSVLIADDLRSITYIPTTTAKPYVDAFDYSITDSDLKASSYVFVSVINTPPVAKDETIKIPKNSENNTIVLTYSDADILDVLTLSITTPPARGSYVLNKKETSKNVLYLQQEWVVITDNQYKLEYTPQKGGAYSDKLVYKVTDGYDTVSATVNIEVVNTAPVAVDDHAECAKNGEIIVNVLENDYDINGDAILLATEGFISRSAHGTLYRINDTHVKYVPDHGFLGQDTANYIVRDTSTDGSPSLTSTGNLIVKVTNTPPVAVDDSLTIPKGLVATLDILVNDYDPNGDDVFFNNTDGQVTTQGITLKVVAPVQTKKISAQQNRQTLEYAALPDLYKDSFTYAIYDVDGGISNVASVSINIINTPPTPVDDTATTHWNTSVVVDVLANDKDENPGDLARLFVTRVEAINVGATASIFEGGKKILVTPTLGFTGTFQFRYYISDSYDESKTSATVTVAITNEAPAPVDDTASVHWRDGSIVIDVLSNDVDVDPIFIQSFTQPAHGQVERATIGQKDALKFTIPATDKFVGTVTFTYVVSDSQLTATATVTVTVTNAVPVANTDSANLHWNTASFGIDVLSNDKDDNSDPLSIVNVDPNQIVKGQISTDGKTVTFKPTTFKGEQTIPYTITDGPATATSSILITTTNNVVPQPKTLEYTVHWSTQTTGTSIPLFTSASPRDEDGDLLVAKNLVQATNGNAVLNAADATTPQTIVYKQNANYLGTDTFTFDITDGLDTATTTVKFTIYNNEPVVKPAAETFHWKQAKDGVTRDSIALCQVTDSDKEDTVSLVSVSTIDAQTQGTITKSGNQVTFTPKSGFVGTVTITLTFTDGLKQVPTTWSITVQNAEPVATPFPTTLHWSTPFVYVDVLSQITDSDSVDTVTFTVTSVATPQGTPSLVTVNNKQVVQWTVPTTNNIPQPTVGATTFTISYTDGWITKTATYPVTVTNTDPTAEDVTVSTHWKSYAEGILIDVLATAKDTDAEDTVTLTTSPFTTPSNGAVTLKDNKALYKPTQGFVGTDSFKYSVTDGLKTITKTVTVNVVDAIPVSNPDTVSVHWASTDVQLNVLSNDKDDDTQDILSIDTTTLTQPTAGSSSIVDATVGTVKYTLAANPTLGDVTFTYKATDGAKSSTTPATVTVTITNTDKPVANPLSQTVHWRTSQAGITYSVYNTAKDSNGDTITLSLVSNDNGACTITGTDIKTIAFQQTATGDHVCTYKLSDGKEEAQSTVTTTITNAQPTASNLNYDFHFTMLETGLEIDLSEVIADTDVADVEFLKIKSFSPSAHFGNCITKVSDTKFNYNPKNSITENTDDTFTYTITDGQTTSETYTISIHIGSTEAKSTDQLYKVHWRTYENAATFQLLQNVTETSGLTNTLTTITLNPDKQGTVTISADKKYVTYKPKQGFVGTEKFNVGYTNGVVSPTIYVTVTVYDNAPTAPALTGTTHFRDEININLLEKTTDADSEDSGKLTASFTSPATSYGTITTVSTGVIKFTPSTAANAPIGTVSFTYTITDGKLSTTGPVTITVTNTPPTTGIKSLNVLWRTFKNTGAVFTPKSLSPVDTDANAKDIANLKISSPTTTVGTVSLATDTITVQYTTQPYKGPVTVTYQLTDGASNGKVTGTVNLNVYNTKPVANPDTATTKWNVAQLDIPVLTNDVDGDSDPLTVTSVTDNFATSAPTIQSGTTVRYYPKTAPLGTTTFTYIVSDGFETAEGKVTVTITNAKPVVKSYDVTKKWNEAKPGLVFNVLADATDADGDSLTLTSVSKLSSSLEGTLTNDGSKITYTPAQGYTGTVTLITYTISDGREESTGTIKITVTNDAPTADTTAYTYHWRQALAGQAIDLTSRLTDANSDTVTIVSVTTQSTAATVQWNSGTKVVNYKTKQAWKGTDSFTVTFTDGWAQKTAVFTVQVTNNIPVIKAITKTIKHTEALNYALTIVGSSDSSIAPTDADTADSSLLTISSIGVPAKGSATISQDSKSITFANTAGNLNTVSFSYSITDGLDTVSSTITINIVDQAPTANNFDKTYHWYVIRGGVDINLLTGSSASDPDGDTLKVISVVQPTNGQVTLKADAATITYTPPTNRAPINDVVTFKISDGSISIDKTLNIYITNAAPVANPDTVTKLWRETSFTISPLDNDVDSNSDPITITSASGSKGTLTISQDKKTIAYNYGGTKGVFSEIITYTITDGPATSTSTITIDFINTAPTTQDLSVSTKWNSAVAVTGLLSKCTDSNNDPLTFQGVDPASKGTVTVTNAQLGDTSYTPSTLITYTSKPSNGAWSTTDSFNYKCSDGLVTSTGKVSVTITNTPPTCVNKAKTVTRDYNNPNVQITSAELLTGATDADSDSLSVSSVALVAGSDSQSSVILQGSNVVFSYGPSYSGVQTFTYTVTDKQLTATCNYVVTIENPKLTCADYTITCSKNDGAIDFSADIRSKNQALNTQDSSPKYFTITNISPLQQVGTISSSLVYTPTKTRSCTGNVCYATYDYSNSAGQKSTCKIIINQSNTAPTAPNWSYTYSARRDGTLSYTLDYLNDANPRDTDTADTVSLSGIPNVGTCGSSAVTSITISNGKIVVVRNNNFIGTCSFTVRVTDSDQLSPLTADATVTITFTTTPPNAVDDSYTTDYNTDIDITASSILSNDYDNLGGTFTVNRIICPDATYCTHGTPTILNPSDNPNNWIIRVAKKLGSCDTEKFQYEIKSAQDGSVDIATVYVRYVNCVCTNKNFDIVFVLDGSGSISSTNWKSMKYFIGNITKGFSISTTKTQIGIVQYSTNSRTELDLNTGTSLSYVQSEVAALSQMGSSTNTISGVDAGITMMVNQGRDSIKDKLVIHVTDGESNLPCSCTDCESYYGLYSTTTPMGNTCLSKRFPGKTCTNCNWNDANSKCMPCGEAVTRSLQINSWKSGNSQNPEASKTWNWRQIAVGIGSGVTAAFGQMQISKMNYDPFRFIMVDWNDLSGAYQTIIDEACNTVSSAVAYAQRPIGDSEYKVQYVGKTLTNSGRTQFGKTFVYSTFTYKVSVAAGGKALKRFTVAMDTTDVRNIYTSSPVFPVFYGTDAVSGYEGFTFESLPKTTDYITAVGQTGTYSISVYGDVPEGTVNFAVQGGSSYSLGTTLGPVGSFDLDNVPIDGIDGITVLATNNGCFNGYGCYAYYKLSTTVNYQIAQRICYKLNGGRIATIKTSQEKSNIVSVIPVTSDSVAFFIALNRVTSGSSSWAWIYDGASTSSFSDFQSTSGTSNRVAIAQKANNYKWTAVSTTNAYQYVVCNYNY